MSEALAIVMKSISYIIFTANLEGNDKIHRTFKESITIAHFFSLKLLIGAYNNPMDQNIDYLQISS